MYGMFISHLEQNVLFRMINFRSTTRYHLKEGEKTKYEKVREKRKEKEALPMTEKCIVITLILQRNGDYSYVRSYLLDSSLFT